MGSDRLHGGFCVGWFMALILDFGYVVVVLFVLRDLCRCWVRVDCCADWLLGGLSIRFVGCCVAFGFGVSWWVAVVGCELIVFCFGLLGCCF